MIRLTRAYTFSASHRLHVAEYSEERNDAVFGKCNNPYGHGHNYILEVTVTGSVDSQDGRVMNVAKLDDLLRNEILPRYDHRNLNLDVAGFATVVPTTENLAVEIRRSLDDAWPSDFPRLERIRIRETDRNIFDLN